MTVQRQNESSVVVVAVNPSYLLVGANGYIPMLFRCNTHDGLRFVRRWVRQRKLWREPTMKTRKISLAGGCGPARTLINKFPQRMMRGVWLALLVLAVAGSAPGAASNPVDWSVGDVFVASGSGGYQVWHNSANPGAPPSYTFLQAISDGSTGTTTAGCAFDSAYRFFGTNFTNSIVDQYSIDFPPYATVKLPPSTFFPLGLAGQFTTGTSTSSTGNKSIVLDGQGNLFVGHAGGGKSLEKWTRAAGSSSYQLQAGNSWTPQVENSGVDWIDLDGTTIYYTSAGRKIFKFNTQAGTQVVPHFADLGQPGLPNYTLFALRLLKDGSGDVLVADKKNIKRVAAGGTVVKTYDASGQDDWEVLSLDPNGTSFWAGDATTHNFYRFNIGSGAIEAGPYTPTGANASLGGICVHGGFSLAQPAATTLVSPVNPSGGLSPSGTNTIAFTTLSGATFTASLVGLTGDVKVTLRESLVQPSVAQSDPDVFSLNPGNPDFGTQVIGHNMQCDQTLTNMANLGNVCEVFEFEANPNAGFTSMNIQMDPDPNIIEHTPNLRFIRNLDEDITAGVVNYPLKSSGKCVFTVNSQTFNFPESVLCGNPFQSPIKGQTFTKNSTSSITFKFQARTSDTGSCGSGPFLTDQGPNALRPLLMITQDVPGAAANSIPVIVAGKSGGPPTFTFTGNTWQLQVKTTNMTGGGTKYLATVIDLNNKLSSFSTYFFLN
jgi:hypothetical protein